MEDCSRELIARSGYSRPGFADRYDAYRPSPPDDLLDLLLRLAGVERARLVVDMGSGTGLSTRGWSDRADDVVGVEPNSDMRRRAENATGAPNVRYVEAFSNATGLPDGSADIVACSQALHWMEPEPTFAEAARLLRAGGVFAAYDYDVPPFVDWEVSAALDSYLRRRGQARERRGIAMGAQRWPKEGHLERMRASGRFHSCREVLVHGTTVGGAAEVVGFAQSIGPVLDETEPALASLRSVAERVLGDRVVRFHWSYRIRAGVK